MVLVSGLAALQVRRWLWGVPSLLHPSVVGVVEGPGFGVCCHFPCWGCLPWVSPHAHNEWLSGGGLVLLSVVQAFCLGREEVAFRYLGPCALPALDGWCLAGSAVNLGLPDDGGIWLWPTSASFYSSLPFLTNHRSSSVNSSWQSDDVSFFIIQGLASLGEKRMILFVILLLGYIIILGGNIMIIFVTLTDPKLTSPMFFFLCNLSFVDIFYATTTIPKTLSGFLFDRLTISIPGCFLQMQFFIQLGVTGHGILTVMAYDRYVAVCNPLRYTAIVTRPVQMLIVLGAWGFGTLCSLPATVMGARQHYCGPNVVRHCWCDPSSVRRLACTDTFVDDIVSVSMALVALLATGVLTSYVLIAVSIFRMGVSQRLKAFGTCAAHLTVVSISYIAASFVYISYRVGNLSPEVRIIVAVLYTTLISFLNPIIYSLRNKELQEAIRRSLSRFRPAAVSAVKSINTVT
ncbi:olfactory receptor 5AN1 [Melanotaenia boesemani]|uniref:olfactory receptor 5AN1 n=1 Tax=Melanotaenia boesemani TaxID=1250792 RepID=UPI001C053660|nr:olfactory receptor 5AN1 [Melanotaenia boesemani]